MQFVPMLNIDVGRSYMDDFHYRVYERSNPDHRWGFRNGAHKRTVEEYGGMEPEEEPLLSFFKCIFGHAYWFLLHYWTPNVITLILKFYMLSLKPSTAFHCYVLLIFYLICTYIYFLISAIPSPIYDRINIQTRWSWANSKQHTNNCKRVPMEVSRVPMEVSFVLETWMIKPPHGIGTI